MLCHCPSTLSGLYWCGCTPKYGRVSSPSGPDPTPTRLVFSLGNSTVTKADTIVATQTLKTIGLTNSMRCCPNCQATLKQTLRSDAKFCSVSCGDVYRSRKRRERLPNYNREQYYANPQHWVRYYYNKYHGISVEELEMMKESQAGKCAICTAPIHVVDHDHSTGKIRAMLCFKCNIVLGHMDDSPALLRSAAEYLEFYAKP